MNALFAAVLLAAACIACDTPCENANEKIEHECHDEIMRAHMGQSYSALPLTGGSEECEGSEECVAECINDTDCESLAYLMAKGPRTTDPNAVAPEGVGDFASCLEDCTHWE